MGNNGSSSSSGARFSHRPAPYEQQPSSWYDQQPATSTSTFPPPAPKPQLKTVARKYSRKYSLILDQFNSLEEVQQALSQAGLESSNLIVGIDFTKSNEWTGRSSFGGHSLHEIGPEPNPYQKAISIVGQTLSPFDDDNLIPCFGFGDSSTHDKQVFSFYADHRPCEGFQEALQRYREIVPNLRLAGPTSFAPIIDAAVSIVEQSGGQYHVLIIIADGQVTRSIDTMAGQYSPQERATIDAIVNASAYPLSIVLVGVGDGPWDTMREFDDHLPTRSFDNFQFVNFTQIMQKNLPPQQKEAQFALAALMEIPQQYKATLELGINGQQIGTMPIIKALPPPPGVMRADAVPPDRRMQQPSSGYGYSQSPSFRPQAPELPDNQYMYPPPNSQQTYPPYVYDNYGYPPSAPAPTTPSAPYESRSMRPNTEVDSCPVCLTDKKDLAFNCGHQTCRQCAEYLTTCPICRKDITTRIRLY